ncbi:MAG: hypothetical protein AB7O67_17880 [Vicinamibacterales bacterium]
MTLKSFGERLVAFLEHPGTVLFVGFVLVMSGLDDLLEEWTGSEGLIDIGVHHGVILYGLHKALLAMGDMIEGGQKALEGRRHRKKAAEEAVARAEVVTPQAVAEAEKV